MIELYAITEDPTPPLPAVEGTELRATDAGGLAVIWGPAGEQDAEVTIDALRRHEAIVEALMAGRDVLPMRFGTRVAGPAAAAAVIAERHDDFARALARVRGTAEVAVRVAVAPGADADPERALAAVHRPLARRARAATCRRGAGGDVLRSAYLVDRDALGPFVEVVGALQQARPELQLLCTGPWPPYSFTG